MSEPTKWTVLHWKDEPATRPTVPGNYVVVIIGDGDWLHESPSYETFATLASPDEDGEQQMKGIHDEEPESMLAWYGPIDLPPCDCL